MGHLAQTPKGNGDLAKLRVSPLLDILRATWPRRRKAMETGPGLLHHELQSAGGHLAQTPKGNGDPENGNFPIKDWGRATWPRRRKAMETVGKVHEVLVVSLVGHLAQTPKGNGDPAAVSRSAAGWHEGPPGPDAERQWRLDDAQPLVTGMMSRATWPRRRKAMETPGPWPDARPGG